MRRDKNKDYKRDGDKLDKGWHGINLHGGYDFPRDDIRTASAGCLVIRSMADHREFMKLVKCDPRYRADHSFIFSVSVMPAAWV